MLIGPLGALRQSRPLALGTCEFGSISLKIYHGNSAELETILAAEPEIITPNLAHAAAVEAALRLIKGSAHQTISRA